MFFVLAPSISKSLRFSIAKAFLSSAFLRSSSFAFRLNASLSSAVYLSFSANCERSFDISSSRPALRSFTSLVFSTAFCLSCSSLIYLSASVSWASPASPKNSESADHAFPAHSTLFINMSTKPSITLVNLSAAIDSGANKALSFAACSSFFPNWPANFIMICISVVRMTSSGVFPNASKPSFAPCTPLATSPNPEGSNAKTLE